MSKQEAAGHCAGVDAATKGIALVLIYEFHSPTSIMYMQIYRPPPPPDSCMASGCCT